MATTLLSILSGALTYSVHACYKGIVGCGLILGRYEETASLRGGNVYHLGHGGLVVHPVNFDDGHVMALEPDILSRERADVNQAEEIRFSRRNGDSEVLRFIKKGSLGYWLRARWVALGVEGGKHDSHLLMVPIRDREDEFFVVQVQEWRVGVVDHQRPSQPVWVLSACVGVVPVCAGLVDLEPEPVSLLSIDSSKLSCHGLTVKLYVKLDPGGILHCDT